jgi:hypothetical protein
MAPRAVSGKEFSMSCLGSHNYLNLQQDTLESFIDRRQLDNLTQPTPWIVKSNEQAMKFRQGHKPNPPVLGS